MPETKQLSDADQESLVAEAGRGLARLDLPPGSTAQRIVKAADDLVEAEQIEREKFFKGLYLLFFKSPEKLISEISALWAQQVVRSTSWTWRAVVGGSEPDHVLVTPDLSLAIYPKRYVDRILRPPYDDNTLMLTFNMLVDGTKLPSSKPGAMEDITGGARHIVPKRVRPGYR